MSVSVWSLSLVQSICFFCSFFLIIIYQWTTVRFLLSQFEAFHVFKVFVANPQKSDGVMEILQINRDRLVKFLTNFKSDKGITRMKRVRKRGLTIAVVVSCSLNHDGFVVVGFSTSPFPPPSLPCTFSCFPSLSLLTNRQTRNNLPTKRASYWKHSKHCLPSMQLQPPSWGTPPPCGICRGLPKFRDPVMHSFIFSRNLVGLEWSVCKSNLKEAKQQFPTW